MSHTFCVYLLNYQACMRCCEWEYYTAQAGSALGIISSSCGDSSYIRGLKGPLCTHDQGSAMLAPASSDKYILDECRMNRHSRSLQKMALYRSSTQSSALPALLKSTLQTRSPASQKSPVSYSPGCWLVPTADLWPGTTLFPLWVRDGEKSPSWFCQVRLAL